jgi:hypothetical protein
MKLLISSFALALLAFVVQPCTAQSVATAPGTPLDIDHMLRGHFHASSPYDAEYAGYGGWGGSGNDFRPITDEPKPKRGVGIIVDVRDQVDLWDGVLGAKVFLYNTTRDTVFFSAQDSRLEMKIQAQNEKGTWQDIQYLPSSWCGNSYHTVYLPNDHYWEFATPIFEGSFQTQLRIQVIFQSEYTDCQSQVATSNTFSGRINPGQFTNKQDYTPQGLMDPYDE